jgi:hypothetical protein
MAQESLSYETPRTPHEHSRAWDFLAGCSLIAPFLIVPVFVLGAGLSQDFLINGDGLSWLRATLHFGVPTGIITVVCLIAAVRAVVRRPPRRGVAIFAVVANASALGLILYGILAAPAAP